MESLKTDILGYMQNIVWHNWSNVGPLFKYGLGVQAGFRLFDDAIKKRHDIVHRSGHTKEGAKVDIGSQEISDLCAQIESFAYDLSQQVQNARNLEDDLRPF
jgi:hypothetical protein